MTRWHRGMPERPLDPPEAGEHCGDEDCESCNRTHAVDEEEDDDREPDGDYDESRQ